MSESGGGCVSSGRARKRRYDAQGGLSNRAKIALHYDLATTDHSHIFAERIPSEVREDDTPHFGCAQESEARGQLPVTPSKREQAIARRAITAETEKIILSRNIPRRSLAVMSPKSQESSARLEGGYRRSF